MNSDINKDSKKEIIEDSLSSTFPKSIIENSISSHNIYHLSNMLNSSFISIEKEERKCQSSFITNSSEPQIPLTQKAILSCLRTQRTTMILQKIILEASNKTIDIIVNQLCGTYNDIIKDKNGNYLFSDLIKVCNQTQRIKILSELTKTLNDECINKFASHAIQTLIEYSSCENEYKLILDSFYDYNKFLYASFDPYGAYVIQKIIEHIPEKFRIKFNMFFISFIPYICLQKYGLCSCKKFILNTKNEENIEKIVKLIRKDFIKIATNNYGNFLIQEMLKKWNNTSDGSKLKEEIIYNFKTLYENKYSYYICDLFLKIANKEEKNKLISIFNFNNININIIISNNIESKGKSYNSNFIVTNNLIPNIYIGNNNYNIKSKDL